jgi:RNA polymerase sigma factor (TIGR02999 family)
MNDVTRILCAIDQGETAAAEELLPLVYHELRKLAAQKLAQEKPGQTLQATALVHEAYLRLVGAVNSQRWDSRGHFFAAAAEAMRRILVETARRRQSLRGGGGRQRQELIEADLVIDPPPDDILALDEALSKFGRLEPQAADLVKLRVFAGMTVEEAARHLGISATTAKRNWAYARAWLRREINSEVGGDEKD